MSTTTTLRLRAEERAALEAAADAAGLGPSSYARRAVMHSVGREAVVRRKPDSTVLTIGRILGDLGRVGNVVNQLARHAHQGGLVPAVALATVQAELARLTSAVLSLNPERRR